MNRQPPANNDTPQDASKINVLGVYEDKIMGTGTLFAPAVIVTDLGRGEVDESFPSICSALLEQAVVVLPGQTLDVASQIEFSQRFGPLLEIPRQPGRRYLVPNPEIDEITNLDADGKIESPDSDTQKFKAGNQLWHSDVSFREVPATASLLMCHVATINGGETELADMRLAYDNLPAALRKGVEGRRALHDLFKSRIDGGYDNLSEAKLAQFPPVKHPIVRTHRETGRKSLFLSQDICAIEGLPDNEARDLIDELIRFSTQEDFVYRHRWTKGDFLIWDNRSTMHRGLAYDARSERRLMFRTTVLDTSPDSRGAVCARLGSTRQIQNLPDISRP